MRSLDQEALSGLEQQPFRPSEGAPSPRPGVTQRLEAMTSEHLHREDGTVWLLL